jgi:hypothetical protein
LEGALADRLHFGWQGSNAAKRRANAKAAGNPASISSSIESGALRIEAISDGLNQNMQRRPRTQNWRRLCDGFCIQFGKKMQCL